MRELVIISLITYHGRELRKEINCQIDGEDYCVPVPNNVEEADYPLFVSLLPESKLNQFQLKS